MEKKWDTVTPADLKKTLCKWDIYVPLVTKGLMKPDVSESRSASAFRQGKHPILWTPYISKTEAEPASETSGFVKNRRCTKS